MIRSSRLQNLVCITSCFLLFAACTAFAQDTRSGDPSHLFADVKSPFRSCRVSTFDGSLEEQIWLSHPQGPAPRLAELLIIPGVQEFLELSPTQRAQIKGIIDSWQKDRSQIFKRQQGYRPEEIEQMCRDTETRLTELLSARQLREQTQLQNQFFVRREGLAAALAHPTFSKMLRLTDDQTQRILADLQSYTESWKQQSDKIKTMYFDQVTAVVTEPQWQRLQPQARDFLRQRIPPLSILSWQMEHYQQYSETSADHSARSYRGFLVFPQFQLGVDGRWNQLKSNLEDNFRSATAEQRRLLEHQATQTIFEGLVDALSSPAIATELGLTAEQQQTLQQLQDEHLAVRDSFSWKSTEDVELARRGLNPEYEKYEKRLRLFCEHAIKTVEETLVPHQRTQLSSMSMELEAIRTGLIAALHDGLLGEHLQLDQQQKQQLLDVRKAMLSKIHDASAKSGAECWRQFRSQLNESQKKIVADQFGTWLAEPPANPERLLRDPVR